MAVVVLHVPAQVITCTSCTCKDSFFLVVQVWHSSVVRPQICIGEGPGVGDDHRVTFTPFFLSSAVAMIFVIINHLADLHC